MHSGKFLLAAVLLLTPVLAQEPPQVHLAQGDLVGVRDHGADAFLDIPFAAPPTGDLRWKPPAPPLPWKGVRDASHFGPSCMQVQPYPGGPWSAEFFIPPPYSEDCLSLNVWTAGGAGKAVLLFIPGGGFNQGGGAISIYNGAAMARAGIVAVTMNYRLTAAGFLAHPELTAQSPHHASGNEALLDMVAALQWIRDNIALFGGDPAKVTVMGQSAGAAAIGELLYSPLAKGLFRGAIIDSGVSLSAPLPDLAAGEKTGLAWAAAHDAATPDQMRALPATAMLPAKDSPLHFGSIIDGYVLPGPIHVAGPPVIDVPILTGWNGGEGAAPPGGTLTTPVSRAEFEALGNKFLGSEAQDLLALYPSGPDASVAMHMGGHDMVMMSGARWAAARARNTHAPLYYYDFEHVMPGYTAANYGSFHSSELPYVFGTLDALAGRVWTPKDRDVSAILQGYWINFIKTGDPNGGALPAWTAFDPAQDNVMALGATPHIRPVTTPARAALFTRFYDRFSEP
jgi:para-nitrobenzyl esterase